MKLVYALVPASAEGALPRGIEGELLGRTRSGDLCAITGDVDDAPSPSPASLRAYDALLRELAASHDSLLPSRFGVVVPDDSALADILDARAAELGDSLTLVRNREQMTMRVFGESKETEMALDPSAGPGARYLQARKAARDRAEMLPEIQDLRDALVDLVRAERVTRHDAPPLLATVAHLIDRGRAEDYRARVESISLSVRVTISGPWPAYTFAPEATA